MKLEINKKEYSISEIAKYVSYILKNTSWKRSFVLLNGAVGTGKTSVINSILDELGIEFDQSPTYIQLKEYSGRSHKFAKLYHLDFYSSLMKVDKNKTDQIIVDILDNNGLFLIEWPNYLAIKEAVRHGNLVIWIEFTTFFRGSISILTDNLKLNDRRRNTKKSFNSHSTSYKSNNYERRKSRKNYQISNNKKKNLSFNERKKRKDSA